MGFLDERLDLADKAAVIVGGGGGLGRAIADDFAASGVDLALCDRNPEALDATATACRETGVQVVAHEADGRDPEALAALFTDAATKLGRVDILVNVIGGTFQQSFSDSNPKGWDALIRTNFTWLLHSTQLALPHLRAAGGGSIINLTSIEAHRAAPGFAVYAAMKAAVTNLTRTLAVELAPELIRVNAIAADQVPTEGTIEIMSPGADAGAKVAIPMGRRGTYSDVGGCALFLASDLSAYVTGTTLHPDGGAWASSGWMNWPEAGWSNVPPPSTLGPDQP